MENGKFGSIKNDYLLLLCFSIYMGTTNIIHDKSYSFALRIITLYKFISSNHKEYVLSKQVLRSGTSIGALVKESEHAQSHADFINKMNIALKEANETRYWLSLLKDSEYLDNKLFDSIHKDCTELISILASIVKTARCNKK